MTFRLFSAHWLMDVLFCRRVTVGISSVRMLRAFIRDGAVPFTNVWHTADKHTKVAFNVMWGMVLFAILQDALVPHLFECVGVIVLA